MNLWEQRLRIMVQFDPMRIAYAVFVAREETGKPRLFATVGGWKEAPDPFAGPMEPLLSLPPEDAQLLMDELWRAGLRPREGTGSAGALAATQAHLKDLQRLVEHAYQLPKVTP